VKSNRGGSASVLGPLAGDEIGVCEALGVVEHGDHDRRYAEYADIRRGQHWQWQGVLLQILQHQHAQGEFVYFVKFLGIRREGGGETPSRILLELGAGKTGSRSREAKSGISLASRNGT
jgi:hypothetical protein